jgi:hypothetical protein
VKAGCRERPGDWLFRRIWGTIVFVTDPDQALISHPRLPDLWASSLSELASLASDMAPPSASLTAAERRRTRRRLEAMAEDAAGLPASPRLAVLVMILCGVQAKLWDSPLGDEGWIQVVGRAVGGLGNGDIPDPLSPRAATWASLAIYLMHEHRPTTGRPAEAVQYEKAADAVSYLLPDADAELLADLAEPFTNASGYPVDPDAVMDVIAMIVQDDPLVEAVDTLEASHPAWDVHKHGAALLHVDGDFRATFLPAAEALEAVPGTGTVAVWSTGTTAAWTLAVRRGGTLIRVEKGAQGQFTWHHYTLGALTTPVGIARDPERANRTRIAHGPLNRPFDEAIEALAATGVSLTTDPPSQCPE